MRYDVAVIGGGPGGYVAAIRAAQLGGKVLLVEKDQLGGVCLQHGCIPTKTLLNSAQKWQELKICAEFGLKAEQISFNFAAVMERKNQVIHQMQSGIAQLIKSNRIDCITGTARFQSANRLCVEQAEGEINYEANKIIIATGSQPMRLPIAGMDLPGVIDSNQLLAMTQLPKSMLVMGAGAVGIEFAAILQAFGCEVTVVELLPTILPSADQDIIKRAGLLLRKQGIRMMTKSKVLQIEESEDGMNVSLDTDKGMQQIVVEKVLAATGRQAVTTGFGLEHTDVIYTRKGIGVNEKMETNVSGIYAIGDVTGQYMLAHVASAEGLVAAENAMGIDSKMDYDAVPACVFTTPEIAMVGLTEQAAAEQNIPVKVSKFNFASNGKAVSMGETDGLVKIIANAADDKVIGMHILGTHASDLIMEGAIAARNGLKAEDIAKTIHPHPSLSEAVMESAHGISGDMIHQVVLKGRNSGN